MTDKYGREWTRVDTVEELRAWVEKYPRPLICNVLTIGEPPKVQWHDMALSKDGKASGATSVASYFAESYGPASDFSHVTH